MPQQPNGRAAGYAARQADLEQRLERYQRGDRFALDGFDDGFDDEVRRAYESQVDPDDFNTEDGFVHACVSDLMAHGELNRGEANTKCHTIWAEHSNASVSPKLPPALNAGQKQVRAGLESAGLERRRPTLDPITMKLWDDWWVRNFGSHVLPYAKAIEKAFKALNKETVRAIKAHNDLVEDLQKERNDSVDAHNANVKAIKALREDVRKETADLIKRTDRSFIAELAVMRESVTSYLGDNLNIMFADVKKLLHLEFTDRIVKARAELHEESRKEIADLIKTKEDLSSEVTTLREKVSCLSDDLNATIADATNIMRGELATEFIKASDTMRKELRQEMRHELAAKIKMMRNTLIRKHRKT
jgi:hypothetical protein